MANQLSILNKELLVNFISNLRSDTPPLFGIMSAQHMIEHLSLLMKISNGKQLIQPSYNEEKSEKIKEYILKTDHELPIGFRSPILPATVLPLEHKDLPSAIEALRKELDDFEIYFAENPLAKPVNPTMGAISYHDWVLFHSKHFLHHFKQFGLL